jgi:hypothetical protein
VTVPFHSRKPHPSGVPLRVSRKPILGSRVKAEAARTVARCIEMEHSAREGSIAFRYEGWLSNPFKPTSKHARCASGPGVYRPFDFTIPGAMDAANEMVRHFGHRQPLSNPSPGVMVQTSKSLARLSNDGPRSAGYRLRAPNAREG